jgi:hypothetical protein
LREIAIFLALDNKPVCIRFAKASASSVVLPEACMTRTDLLFWVSLVCLVAFCGGLVWAFAAL